MGHAEAGGDTFLRRQRFDLHRRDSAANTFRQQLRAGRRGIGQNHDKFLTTITIYTVAGAGAFDYLVGNLGQHDVADDMTKTVVDRFEMIDIDDQQGQRRQLTLGQRYMVFELSSQHGAIVNASEWVLERDLQGTLVLQRIAQRINEGAEQHFQYLQFRVEQSVGP